MGQDVEIRTFTRADRTRFRRKVHRCLDAFAQLLADSQFAVDEVFTGLEIELNLVDDQGRPAMRSAEVLEAIGDPAFQSELGLYNIEVNIAPRRLDLGGFKDFEDDLRGCLDAAGQRSSEVGAHLLMIGILPTLFAEHLSADSLAPDPRYTLLNEQILLSRGEDVALNIDGVEQLTLTTDSIAPEAACTSSQLHIQVSPADFPAYWNAAQAIAGIQVAVGANSPYFAGRQLWCESRIQVFEQAIDTRTEELKAQGVRPRVWFGERWISSIFDLFAENARYFPALLPVCADEDPLECLATGRTPTLSELRLHNGTIWRWNRPVYDIVDDAPHLRVENRVLPSGPTLVDTLANAAFYFGLVRRLAEDDQPIWREMSFSAAAENFTLGARYGLDASLYWPGVGTIGVGELVLRKLLPMAYDGLAAWGVDAADSSRLLEVIEQRCLHARNGASWQVATVNRLMDGQNVDRERALHEMTVRYLEHMLTNAPVHTWPTP